jgi:hypothetical protein
MASRFAEFAFVAALAALPVRPAHAQAVPLRDFSSTPTCATCRIVLDSGVILRLPHDSLSFGYTSRLAKLRDGSFLGWELNETRVPARFGADGAFGRIIARSGVGPGEMGSIWDIFVGRGDSIWVMDHGPWTWHVLTPDAGYVRREPLEPEPSDMIHTPDGRVIAAAWITTPISAGLPLHLLDQSGTVLRSFGLDQALTPQELRMDRSLLSRRIARGAGNTFWAYSPTRFFLERYDTDGRLLARLRHAMDGWYRVASENQPGEGDFPGRPIGMVLESASADITWLLYYLRNENFVRPVGGLDLGTYEGMHDLVVEALHTRTYQVVATQRFPGVSARQVRNATDEVALIRRVDADFHTFQMAMLRLVRP